MSNLVLGTSLQPSYAPLSVCVAHAVAFLTIASPRHWFVYGIAHGAAFASPLVLALAPHGWQLAIGAPLMCACFVACGFGAGAAAGDAVRLPSSIAVPLGWGFVCTALDHAGLSPVPLFVGLLKLDPSVVSPVRVFGAYGLDALLLALCASGALAWKHGQQQVFGALALTYGAAWIATLPSSPPSGDRTRVAVIQPNTPMSEHQAMGWSLVTRRVIRERLNDLIEQASDEGGSLLVLPENAGGTPDIQLQQRVRGLASLLGDDHQTIVLSSDVHYEDASLGAVAVLDSSGIKGLSHKAKPLPFAESDLSPGLVRVLPADRARLGVLICFDSMFGEVWRQLVRDGADIATMVSNDESFGRSPTVIAHALVTRLRMHDRFTRPEESS